MALAREKHRAYIKRVSEDTESFEFAVSEHLRMSGVYWGACARTLLPCGPRALPGPRRAPSLC